MLPWRNSQPCGILDHHIHTKHKTEIDLHHNRGSCDQETTLPNNKDSAHKPCSFCHQPVFRNIIIILNNDNSNYQLPENKMLSKLSNHPTIRFSK